MAPAPVFAAQAKEAVETAFAASHAALHRILEHGIRFDPNQTSLFAASPALTDIAASEPPWSGSMPFDGDDSVRAQLTLAEARRRSEITTELRGSGDRG